MLLRAGVGVLVRVCVCVSTDYTTGSGGWAAALFSIIEMGSKYVALFHCDWKLIVACMFECVAKE